MPNKYEIIANPKQGTDYIISIWDSIEEYEDYDKLFQTLAKITKNDSVQLQVSTSGGRCSIGFNIINRLQEIECNIDVVVPYPTYSMGAIMALCGNSLEVKPGAFLMFHDYSTGTRGKGNEIYKQTEAYKEIFEYRFLQICRPFLTKKECDNVLNGKDLYIKWNDPTLEARIKRHFK